MCGRYVITNAVSKTSKIVKTAIKVEDSENYNAHPVSYTHLTLPTSDLV